MGAGVAGAAFPSRVGGQQEPQAVGKPYGLQPDDKPKRRGGKTSPTVQRISTSSAPARAIRPSRRPRISKTKPWTVRVDGLANKPADYQLEDFLKPSVVEDRIYRHRCVEAWSMVIPWRGIPLADVIQACGTELKGEVRRVHDALWIRDQMPGERSGVLPWPYTEGLRLDEAMNPLALLAVGVYGRVLPNQNGAPLRLVLPWKYGFKSIESRSCASSSLEFAAEDRVESGRAKRIRVLFEREPDCRSPAMESGHGAPHRRVPQAEDADVQRLHGAGWSDVRRRMDPAGELLN